MRTTRVLLGAALSLLGLGCLAQTDAASTPPPLSFAQQLLMEERPPHLSAAQWEAVVRNPLNVAVFPVHIDAAMVDTVPASWWDPRYHYVLVPKRKQAVSPTAAPATR